MIDRKVTFVDHLQELRARIIKSVISILGISCIFFNFTDEIIPYLVRAVEKLVFISPQEAFITNIKIALLGGIFLSSPLVLYQIWKFISVGLMPNERKYILIFGPASFVFFVLGACFAFFVIIPIGIEFLLGFRTNFVTPMITISNYVSFIGTLTLAFGIVFQLPLISLFLTKMNIVTPEFLCRKRKHALVFIFISAAIFTPPDVITQGLMSLPLMVLYEMGIIFSRFIYNPV